MYPILLNIGPLTIHTYGFMLALGVALGLLLMYVQSKKHGLQAPVMLDMAENYPAALIAYENAFYKPFLLGNGFLPRLYEKAVVKKLDHIFVVAEEQIKRLGKLGVPNEKITLIQNTPEPGSFSNPPTVVQL